MKPTVLITGASGFVGEHLARRFRPDYSVYLLYSRHRPHTEAQGAFQVDISSPEALRTIPRSIAPDVVVHTAAMVNPDRCEERPDLARSVNVEGTRHIARWAEERGARLIYFSTDLVYDGEKGMYHESDAPLPRNVYGQTKLEGEERIKEISTHWVIIRLALSYGPTVGASGDWTLAMRRDLSAGKDLHLFTDQFRTPAYVGDTVEVVFRLAGSPLSGIYHVGGSQRVSRYEFGVKFSKVFGVPLERVHPVEMKDVPMKAVRARDCSLNTAKVSRDLGVSLSSVDSGLARHAREEMALALQ